MDLVMFAEQLDAASQTFAVGGWVGALLSVLATGLSAYLAYRAGRDRMTLDVEKVKLQDRVDVLEAATARGEADCQRRLEVVQAQVTTLRLELEVERAKTLRLGERLAHESDRRRQTVRTLNDRVDQLDPSKSQGQSSLSLGGTGESAAG